MDFGFFGKAFDFNFDGHLDSFERAADFVAFMNLRDELNMMDDWERREAFEDAGLDPDDYDFDF